MTHYLQYLDRHCQHNNFSCMTRFSRPPSTLITNIPLLSCASLFLPFGYARILFAPRERNCSRYCRPVLRGSLASFRAALRGYQTMPIKATRSPVTFGDIGLKSPIPSDLCPAYSISLHPCILVPCRLIPSRQKRNSCEWSPALAIPTWQQDLHGEAF